MTTELDLDAIERQILALIERNEDSDVHAGVPPVLALGLVQRCRRAEAIVRDLAASPPSLLGVDKEGMGLCSMCGALVKTTGTAADEHYETCLHRRAVEAGKP